MSWATPFVGLPYLEGGRGPLAYDCLGLFIALQQARFGRDIPDPSCSMAEAVRHAVVDAARNDWKRVEIGNVQEGDALLFLAAGRALHLGFALDARDMIHTEAEASCVEAWTGPARLGKLEGVYRFV